MRVGVTDPPAVLHCIDRHGGLIHMACPLQGASLYSVKRSNKLLSPIPTQTFTICRLLWARQLRSKSKPAELLTRPTHPKNFSSIGLSKFILVYKIFRVSSLLKSQNPICWCNSTTIALLQILP